MHGSRWRREETRTSRASTCRAVRAPLADPTNRHYVDGWVMWPAGVFPLLAGVVRAGSGHITRDRVGRWSGSPDWLSMRAIRSVLSIQ